MKDVEMNIMLYISYLSCTGTEKEEALTLPQGNHTHQQEDHAHQGTQGGVSVKGASDEALSAEEKRRLIAQYDCESDEEQYPPCTHVCVWGGGGGCVCVCVLHSVQLIMMHLRTVKKYDT